MKREIDRRKGKGGSRKGMGRVRYKLIFIMSTIYIHCTAR